MTTDDQLKVSGSRVVNKIMQLIREGNVRRIRLIHKGNTILKIPLTIGASAVAVMTLLAPLLAAIGTFVALVTKCTIEAEKVEES